MNARAMASYAVLGSLSGFRYSAARKTLWFGPRLDADRFKTFFSTASGFGTITRTKASLTIEMVEGRLQVDELYLDGKRIRLKSPAVAEVGKKAAIRLS